VSTPLPAAPEQLQTPNLRETSYVVTDRVTQARQLVQSKAVDAPWANALYRALETDIIPEWLIRVGIRRMLAQKIVAETEPSEAAQQAKRMAFFESLKAMPIAIDTRSANDQHYEVPTEFFNYVLGPHKKYSCAWWTPQTDALPHAEAAMLALTCERAQLADGQTILELGCGWGSLSLWMATHYPNATIKAVSNSRTQKAYIDTEAQKRNLNNLQVITANMVDFDATAATGLTFDRVVSVEMFEHMKNYQALLARISHWLKPDGKLFVHIFTHQTFAYHYEDTDGTDWLTRYFFAGGTMPSDDLLLYFQRDLRIEHHWRVDGTHYQQTANAWWNNMRAHRAQIMPILANTYGAQNAKRWWVYWKLFFLACAELWGYDQGRQWLVSHYLFNNANG
jgi:cyclopropane-fatty-acyl-phospholipid synthase